jgi:hypothetical protein
MVAGPPLYLDIAKHISTVETGEQAEVRGVASIGDLIFVVFRQSKFVAVFKLLLPQCHHLRNIEVDGLSSARDMTSCPETRRLYIADTIEKSIWRLTVDRHGASAEPAAVKWISTPLYRPWSLSMSTAAPRRLLVVAVSDARRQLFVYEQDAPVTTALEIRLPDWMIPQHAAETTRRTFVVCYRIESASANGDACKHYQVSEVDVKGYLMRTFGRRDGGGQGRLNNPSHVIWDPSGDDKDGNGERDHVIIADSGNHRLLVLNGDLQPEHDWPVEVRCSANADMAAAKPSRLHLVNSRSQLIVGLSDSNCCVIYSIK